MAAKNMGTAEKTARIAVVIMIVTVLSKILGFGREMAIAARFGASMYTDAYKMGQLIPLALFSTVAAALSTTFIPVLTEYLHNKTSEQTNKYVNNVLNVVMVICIGLSGVGLIFSPSLTALVAPGFKGEVMDITIRISRIMFSMIIFNAMAAIATGYLQAKGQFVIPAMIGIPFNVIIITQLLFFNQWGIYGLAISTVLGVASQFFMQWPAMLKYGYRYRFMIDFHEPGLNKVLVLVMPVLVGTMVGQLNTLVDRILASGLPAGSISALDFGNRINGIVLGIFVSAITTVLYPTMAGLAAQHKVEQFKETLNIGARIIILLTLPMMVGLIVLREPIIRLLFERGAFDTRATDMTATALLFYSLSLVAYGVRDLVGRAFYALQDTRTPMLNGMLSVAINIILNIILVRYMGLGGLALATSISAVVTTVTLFARLKAKVGVMGAKKIVVSFIKLGISSVVMGLVVYLTNAMLIELLPGNSLKFQVLRMIADIAVGMAVYGVAAFLLKAEELSLGWNMVKQRIMRRNSDIPPSIHDRV